MKILQNADGFEHNGRYLAVALGNFDGLHLGHQKLLRQARTLADEQGGDVLLLTFDPHPLAVLTDAAPALLTGREEKRRLAAELGVDCLLELPFTPELAAMSAEDFVQKILYEQLRADLLAVGFNFRFGARGRGDVGTLKSLDKLFAMQTLVLPPFEVDGEAVSSSRIRGLLAKGEARAANRLLGRSFALCGRVIHGQELGRKLGFATANMAAKAGLALPAYGVYAARAKVAGGDFAAVVNIGVRPTVGEAAAPVIEAHLLDVEGLDLYGQELRLEMVAEIRPERKFADLAALTAQIAKDKEVARQLLR